MPREELISGLLKTRLFGRRMYCLDTVCSTNDYLRQMAQSAPCGAAVLADTQTCGRGRNGRAWVSHGGAAVYLSLLVKPLAPENGPVLALVCGLAALRALEGLCGGGFAIKWPNDILLAEKKVAGILCESKFGAGSGYAVCGFGVNLAQEGTFFTENGLPHASSVRLLKGSAPSVEETAAALLNTFETEYDRYIAEGGESLIEAYTARCLTLGRAVRVKGSGGEIAGRAVKLLPDGALLVRAGGREIAVHAGEVSVRGAAGYV